MKQRYRIATLLYSASARVSLFLIGCFFVGLPVSRAQNPSQTLVFAEDQYRIGNYESALTAYQRFLFFNKEDQSRKGRTFFRLADCFFQTKKYDQAAGYYDLAFFSLDNDSMKQEAVFQKISCMLLKQQYQLALVELMTLPDSMSNRFVRKKYFYSGITYFALNDFDAAQNDFIRMSELPAYQNKIKALFVRNKKLQRIHPKTAMVLSMIIPGMGQLYSGDYRNAINSFTITSAFMVLGIETALAYSFIDALIAVFPWYQRYYMGGYNKAETIAIARIQQKRYHIYQGILTAVEEVSH